MISISSSPTRKTTISAYHSRNGKLLNVFISVPELIYLQIKVFKKVTCRPFQVEKVKALFELTNTLVFDFEDPT